MSGMSPFAQLIGVSKIYLAPYGTALPTLDTTPAGAWVELGPTDGDQTITSEGDMEYWTDNDGNSNVTARRGESTVMATFTLVGLTMENLGRVMHNISNIITTTSGALAVKEVGLEQSYVPTEYALLIRGDTMSPYGVWPAQTFIPRGIFENSVERGTGKTTRAEIECEFSALRDDAQVSGKKLGWSQAQAS